MRRNGNRCEMDIPESTKVVFSRVQKLEPEHVSKIVGYLLLQDNGVQEMIRVAFGPDHLLQSLINQAKIDLGLSSKPAVSSPIQPISINTTPVSDLPLQFTPFSPASSRPFSSPATFRVAPQAAYWDQQVSVDQPTIHNGDYIPSAYSETIPDEYRLHNQAHYLSLEDQLESLNIGGHEFSSNYYYPDGALGPRNRRSPSLPEFPVKACHYFNKGYCKHGSSCRYLHGQSYSDNFSQIFSPTASDLANDDHMFLPGSLEKLELELTDLLKCRRGLPVSIASLPMLYYEKYGKTLQADGYLTESQRHGKAGYSLTKLLARLKNSIRLIDRPHGQHSVVLAEDAPRYTEYRSERSDPGGIVAGSRQIYLTFPADSTFTEEDVSDYFNRNFGPVQDVRIPCQQKRMFGFVTFVYPETVKAILTKGNPHFVGGARVLVKPYREKSRLVDRKYSDKMDPSMYYPTNYLEMEHELQSMPRVCENSRLLRRQLLEEQEHALEFERRRLSEFQLAAKSLTNRQPYFGYSMDDFKFSEDNNEFSSADRFKYLLDVINNGSSSDDKARNLSSNYNDQESQGLNLPESPFASQMTSISTVI